MLHYYKFRTDFCADSIIKRDLSNTLYARTRDYDAAQRLIDQTAETYFDMPLDDSAKFQSMTCEQLSHYAPLPPVEYINLFQGMKFLTGFIKDTNTTAPIYNPPYDEYMIQNESKRLTTLNYMYIYYIILYYFRLPNILKSTAGGLSVWLIVGVKQLFISKIYKDTILFPPEAACIFPQDMWDYYFLPYLVYLPQNKGTIEDPIWERVPNGWSRPTCDAVVVTSMTEYIYPLYRNYSDVDSYYGQLIVDLEIGEVFKEALYGKDNETYGFNFLVSTYDYKVVACSSYATKMLFNTSYTIDELSCGNGSTFNISTTGFASLHDLLPNPMVENTKIHSILNNRDYYVTWVREDSYKYILVAAVLESVLNGASWEIQTSSVRYSSEDSKEESFVIVKNTGNYNITFTLSISSDIVIIDKKYTGQLLLKPHSVLNITYTLNLKKRTSDSFTITFVPNGDNYECYSSLLGTVNLINIDCISDDYEYELSECNSNYRHKVHYKWKNDSICRGGIDLPDDEEVPCQWFDNNAGFISYCCIVCGLGLIVFIFVGIKLIKSSAELRAMEPITFFICYMVGVAFTMICILILCFGELKKIDCTVFHVFRTFGSLFIEVAVLCILIQINTVYILLLIIIYYINRSILKIISYLLRI